MGALGSRSGLQVLAWTVLLAGGVGAAVKPVPLFTDHMVLQRDAPLPVWGSADPGEVVTVSIAGKSVTATADAKGEWRVTLPALAAGGPYALSFAGTNAVEVTDVLVGEVWICSGQSNMNFRVNRVRDAEAEAAKADYPKLRLFQIQNRVSREPSREFAGSWTACTPQTAPTWTAVGYFFGRELVTTLDVPVGLIHTSWGGTPAEAWTSAEALAALPECQPITDRFRDACARYPEAKAAHEQKLVEWKQRVAEAKAAGKRLPVRPADPMGPANPRGPCGLYNAMILPLVPYAIRGAIWYQGESNAGRAYQYRTLFPAMIRNWREVWAQGDFPFYFVQLANFKAAQTDPNNGSEWAELREAQTMAMSLPHTGMACTIDIGEADDIHPRNKQDVGHRLALWALAQDYGRPDTLVSGPVFKAMTKEGAGLRLHFDRVGSGLAVHGEKLQGFAVAGEDRRFVWAEARIDGDAVVVQSPQVPAPVAARYGWADNPPCNLTNREGLPAAPFRTDSWPGVTEGKL